MKPTILITTAAILFSSPLFAQTSPGIPGVIAPGVEPELVQEGFVFTEGPVGTPDGGLYFSDIRPNKIYLLDAGGKIALVREQSNGSNGLAVTKDGDLYAAEGGGQRISKRGRDGTITAVTEATDRGPFLSPNDLFLDAKGGIYITDPGPRPVVPGRPTSVSYLAPGAKQAIVIDGEVARPNGLTLTLDGKTLIVDLRDIPEGKESGADGLAIDREGRLYITTLTGVQVLDAKGAYLGTIKVPRQPANAAFAGPDKRVLYITAREGLYRVKLLAQGPDRVGK